MLERLGQGGMGVVWKARQVKLDRLVAVKLIRGWSGDGAAVARFCREAELLARIKHPNVVQIYEIGEHEGCPYFVMEYVEGGNLASWLAGRPQPPQQAAAIVETLARTMYEVHLRGIVHRDLKPANVLLSHDRQSAQKSERREAVKETALALRLSPSPFVPKITDFGLAKPLDTQSHLSATGEIKGTPSYMAPEQAGGVVREIGPVADVYALGAILYEMLTGRPPFVGSSSWEVVGRVLTDEPTRPRRIRPDLPRDLETICLKCLEKAPGQRYASAAELADDLERFRRGEPICARPTSFPERAWKWVRRRPAAAAMLLLAAAALATGVAAYWYRWSYQQSAARQQAAALADLLTRARTLASRAEKYRPIFGARLGIGRDLLNDADVLLRELRQIEGRPPAALEALGRLQLAFASIDIRRNDTASALARAREAQSVFDELASRSDAPPTWREWQARTYETLGRVRGAQGHLSDAHRSFRQAHALAETYLGEQPNDPSRQALVAQTQYWLAEALLEAEDEETAASLHSAALATRRRLAQREEATPQLRQDLAKSLQALAHLDLARGNGDSALAQLQEALALFQKLADLPDSSDDVQNELAHCHEQLGDFYRSRGEAAHARKHFEAARDLGQPFVKQYPHDVHWRTQQLSVQFKLADLLSDLSMLRERAPVLLAVNASLADALQTLAKEDPHSIHWQVQRMRVLMNAAHLHAGLGALDADPQRYFQRARELHTEVLAILERCRQRDPETTRWHKQEAAIHYLLAGIAATEGDEAEARKRRRMTIELWVARAEAHVQRQSASRRWRGERAQFLGLLAAVDLTVEIEGRQTAEDPTWKRVADLLDKAHQAYDELLMEEPDSRTWLQGQLQVLQFQALLYRITEQTDLRDRVLQEQKRLTERLVALPPAKPPPLTEPPQPAHLSLTLAASGLPMVRQMIRESASRVALSEQLYGLRPTEERATQLAEAYQEHAAVLRQLPVDWAAEDSRRLLQRGRDFLLDRKKAGTLSPAQAKMLAEFEAALQARPPD